MATQPPPPRTWFRLPTMIRAQAPPAAPTPEPPAPQPRPPMIRAPFRPMGMPQPQPTQPQEYTPAEPPPPPPPAVGASSVPTSPIRRTSVPSSPTMLPATLSPPKTQVSAPSSSLPTSPSLKPPASPPKPSISSMPTSPSLKPSASPPTPPKLEPTTFSAPTSPPKPSPSRFLAPTSPPKPEPTTFSVPTSPPKPAPSRFLAPTSPPKPEPSVTTTIRMPSPTPSPRTIKPADKTPPQSPYNKPTAPPPSPLVLPPPQLKSKAEFEPTIPAETEQKTVLVQTTSEKPKSWINGAGNHKGFEDTHKHNSHARHGNHEVHKDVAKKEKDHRKKFSSDSEHEVGMRVITIAGENKGAFMEVIKSPSKHSFDGNSHTLHKTESDGTGWKSFSSSDEGKSKKDKNHNAKAMLSPPMGAFMNSNVQGVNNSIVFHSSCSHHDPGVHLSLSRKPSGNGFHVKDKSNGGHHS